MKWKNLAIGKKLFIGFGSVLILLALISGYSFIGLNEVGHLAQKEQDLAEGGQFMLLKTIDHLNWVSNLSDLVFKGGGSAVWVETDDHKCGLGKWLYSDQAKDSAAENKEVGSLLEAIKEPHRKLHSSAVKIQETYVDFDGELDALLMERWIDHLVWIKKLNQSIMTGAGFKGGLDPKLCAFGKWFYSYNADDPTLKKLLDGWEDPHNKLHQSALEVVRYIDRQDLIGASRLYQQQTIPALEMLAVSYEKTMDWIDASKAKQVAAQGIFTGETTVALGKTKGLLDKIRESYSDELVRADALMMTGIDNTKTFSSVLAAIAIVFGIFTAFLIARSITRPIAKGVAFAKAMSGGDLTQSLDVNQKDEIGTLSSALNTMAKNLRTMFLDVSQGVETLTSSSTELSAISEQMASSAEQTSGKANLVAVAAEQMSSNMKSVSASSEEASTNLQMVAAASEQMSATISEITNSAGRGSVITDNAVTQAKSVSTRVDELGKAANEIGKVTATINDISEQTNLLALNATIEAARAGEAGKGFAVVANEIKELAKQTADATQDIHSKIEGIQASTNETVTEISQIQTVITDINDIVNNVASAVEEQAVSTREISSNINQVANGIDDVNENVAQSSTVSVEIAQDVVEVNQASSEMKDGSLQVNSSANELSKLAEQLSGMIGQFKI